MNILDSATALAGGQQRVLLGCVIDPAEPAEGQLFVHAHDVDVFVFNLLLGLLPSVDLGDLALVSGIHPSDDLLINSSGTTHHTFSKLDRLV
jgi:hypothetical protein